ncbi:uncharacterized protein BDZ83DRAFT_773484 [Colletotrichum acutatum]|uniref:Uncharacterized protein n=1 Tax=Glomerella acutata TaxID=27357 RepID=A0AAD8XPU6_GLOAC|nr:uncharacterized protein BDZ83DRAFT_773484 [Colletotrichum acutatum]KAK1731340.1 hypothetical protein BDZ83DRAFT_773484 [Colletotrichum acutatum]
MGDVQRTFGGRVAARVSFASVNVRLDPYLSITGNVQSRGANCDETATTCVSPPGPKLEFLEAQRGQRHCALPARCNDQSLRTCFLAALSRNLVSPPVPGHGPSSRSPIKPFPPRVISLVPLADNVSTRIGTNLPGFPNSLPVLACSCHQVPPGLEATSQSRKYVPLIVSDLSCKCEQCLRLQADQAGFWEAISLFPAAASPTTHSSQFPVPFLIPPLALTFTIHRSPYRSGLRYLTGALSHVNLPSQFCAIHSQTKRGSPGTVPILAFPLPGSAQSSHPVSRSSHKMQIFPTGDIPSRTSLTTHLARPEF